MPLSDVTEPAAVLAAIAEYDVLGPERFLKQFGYRPSRTYLLEHQGRTYDSKAIIGVARGMQHPALGAMRASEFSGGARGAAERLRSLGFIVRSNGAHSNPNWSNDELILALDVYLRHAPKLPATHHPDVIELSECLQRLSGGGSGETFRNLNGVHLKLANFAALDPRYPGTGSTHGGRATAEAWDRWASHPEQLHEVATAIRTALGSDAAHGLPEEDDEESVPEGATLYRLHRVTERNRSLRRKKLARVKAAKGVLTCESCDAHLPSSYGEGTEDVVEVHHVVPLSKSGSVNVRLDDLAVLCPTCHRVIHRLALTTPFELRHLIETRRGTMTAAPPRA